MSCVLKARSKLINHLTVGQKTWMCVCYEAGQRPTYPRVSSFQLMYLMVVVYASLGKLVAVLAKLENSYSKCKETDQS